MRIALQLAAAWGLGDTGYSATICDLLSQWIASDDWLPIPWPDQAFVEKWLRDRGYTDVDGAIGMKFTAEITKP